MGKVLAVIGIIATAIYGVYIYVSLRARLDELQGLQLNNIGDFLAGIFGPLAFLWLVLGFFQQGIELRVQASELRSSVRQQKEMTDIATGQLKVSKENAELEHRQREASIEPKFSFDYESQEEINGVNHFHFLLSNGGYTITCVAILIPEQQLERKPFFNHSKKHKISIKLKAPENEFRMSIFVTYLNGLEDARKKEFPIYFRRGLEQTWTISIDLPQGKTIGTQPG